MLAELMLLERYGGSSATAAKVQTDRTRIVDDLKKVAARAFPPELLNVVLSMLDPAPAQRPRADQVRSALLRIDAAAWDAAPSCAKHGVISGNACRLG